MISPLSDLKRSQAELKGKMVGVKPKTLEKTENLVRDHPKTSKKLVDIKSNEIDVKGKGKAQNLFYAVAYGRKTGVFCQQMG